MRFYTNILLFFLLFLTACQLYKNSDRDRFEQNAPGKLIRHEMQEGTILYQVQSETCKVQNEELPITSHSNKVYSQQVNENEIEVCDVVAADDSN